MNRYEVRQECRTGSNNISPDPLYTLAHLDMESPLFLHLSLETFKF